MKPIAILFIALSSLSLTIKAQQGFVHPPTIASGYIWPQDTAVLSKLEKWQDLKFGIIFHYGLYSLPGIVESWSICSEDVDWINRPHLNLPYDDYKAWYWSLSDSINPVNYDPEAWARLAQTAGAKYAILTTKHHDGFCLFNSQFTDFSLPAHGGTDLIKGFTQAFRNHGMMVGTYFSKPDWHCPWFWNPQFSTPNRHENYIRDRHPQWWTNYVTYTQNQIDELTNGQYGPIDILWLDGGWVSGDEIGLDSILVKARKVSPGMLCVDRSIGGKNENYQTPERGIPDSPMFHPWESCIPLSDDWGWVPNPHWKSAEQVISLLAETVSKGGSLLLGVGPTASGQIQPEVAERLNNIGQWLKINGDAIYTTIPLASVPKANDHVFFTMAKDSNTCYLIYAPSASIPCKEITWSGLSPKGNLTMLGHGKIKYTTHNGTTTAIIPPNSPSQFVLRFTPSQLPISRTIEEKCAQLCCVTGWEMYDGVNPSAAFMSLTDSLPVGGLWATMRADPWTKKTLTNGLDPSHAAQAANNLQNYYQSKVGSPLMLAEECTHGHMAIGQTVFPTGLCQASTFNPPLIKQMGEAVAQEALEAGATLGYGPIVDVARDPRWSRMEESYGEDPELVSQMAVSYIKGMQGASLPATIKHFAAYGVPTGGHNGAEASVGSNRLQELIKPAQRAVEEGKVASVMTSYNSIDDIPSTANSHLLKDVLRDQWGFDGMVVSDLIAINGLCGSGYARDYTQAAAMALNAGVDMDLGGSVYSTYLPLALKEGLVSEAQIDTALARVNRLKAFPKPAIPVVPNRNANQELARKIAEEGTVLLKNNGLLPLQKGNIRKIAVIGPNANTIYNQLGDYTAPQPAETVSTPLKGIRDIMGNDCEVVYNRVCGIRQPVTNDSVWDSLVKTLDGADVAVIVVGGSSGRDFKTDYAPTGAAMTASREETALSDMDCGEGMDRSTLSLLGSQEELLNRVKQSGIPMVVVYIQGRPLDMNWAADNADALLTQWYPGAMGGEALARILFGEVNPSGRLPVSIPRSVGQLPLYYSQPPTGSYIDGPATPLYPFGYGLSYSDFEYSNPLLTADSATVIVTNGSAHAGQEVVQLYQLIGNRKQLVDFKKIFIPAHSSQQVTFPITPEGIWLIGPDSTNLAPLF